MEPGSEILQDLLESTQQRRRKLLPWWVRFFVWVFMIIGGLGIVAFALSVGGGNFQSSLYGLETNDPLSATGIILISLFFFKGITAYGLWTEQAWAITLGIIDAVLGLVICVFVVFYSAIEGIRIFNFRLEIVLLIPYLVWLLRVRKRWSVATKG